MTMMSEATTTPLVKRSVNIDSAIDQSSFQMPVFVAISTENGEAQVAKTFATARDVFEHIFSIMLDRILQRRAVDAVEALVPPSAELKSSRDTEYVLLVRGRAIFWFSGIAAKRSAGRRLLLEHARRLADAEQKPFYILNSPTRKIRAAGIVLGVVIIVTLALIVSPLVIQQARHALRQHGSPESLKIESREPTVDRFVPLRVAAGDSTSRRRDPAPATAVRPGPVGPGPDTAATVRGRPRSPVGFGFSPDLDDRFQFRGDRPQQADPFADPFPAADTQPTVTRPTATLARRAGAVAVPPIATDQVPVRQHGAERDRVRPD